MAPVSINLKRLPNLIVAFFSVAFSWNVTRTFTCILKPVFPSNTEFGSITWPFPSKNSTVGCPEARSRFALLLLLFSVVATSEVLPTLMFVVTGCGVTSASFAPVSTGAGVSAFSAATWGVTGWVVVCAFGNDFTTAFGVAVVTSSTSPSTATFKSFVAFSTCSFVALLSSLTLVAASKATFTCSALFAVFPFKSTFLAASIAFAKSVLSTATGATGAVWLGCATASPVALLSCTVAGVLSSAACADEPVDRKIAPKNTDVTPNENLRIENRWRVLKISFIYFSPF